MERLGTGLEDTGVIPWACPVPCFGDPAAASVATLSLNPSSREFVDGMENELQGAKRRFPTLHSLKLTGWSEAGDEQAALIERSCRTYFSNRPLHKFFKPLDNLLGCANASYYDDSHGARACHFDLVPYATMPNWGKLSNRQRAKLWEASGDALGLLVRESPVRLLVLNGSSVAQTFGRIPGVTLRETAWPDFDLPGVPGMAYEGQVNRLFDIDLNRSILVVGFNHNIPGRRGVTRSLKKAIREWIGARANPAL